MFSLFADRFENKTIRRRHNQQQPQCAAAFSSLRQMHFSQPSKATARPHIARLITILERYCYANNARMHATKNESHSVRCGPPSFISLLNVHTAGRRHQSSHMMRLPGRHESSGRECLICERSATANYYLTTIRKQQRATKNQTTTCGMRYDTRNRKKKTIKHIYKSRRTLWQ